MKIVPLLYLYLLKLSFKSFGSPYFFSTIPHDHSAQLETCALAALFLYVKNMCCMHYIVFALCHHSLTVKKNEPNHLKWRREQSGKGKQHLPWAVFLFLCGYKSQISAFSTPVKQEEYYPLESIKALMGLWPLDLEVD